MWAFASGFAPAVGLALRPGPVGPGCTAVVHCGIVPAYKHECVGDVRGEGLYRMLDIVTDRKSRNANPALAEGIRREAMAEGLAMIAVKNYMRICPPLIVTAAEIEDIIGRLDKAIARAVENQSDDIDFSSSSSLAANDGVRRIA